MNKTHERYVDQIEQIVRESGRPYVAVADAKKAISSEAGGLRTFSPDR